MKTKINDRIIKWFFGIDGVVDERVRNEIGSAASKTLIVLFIFEIVFNAVVNWYALSGMVHNFENFFYLVMLIQFIALLVIIVFFTTVGLRNRGVINKEVTAANRGRAIKRIRNKWLKLAPVMFILDWLLNAAFQFAGQNYFKNLFTGKEIFGALIFAIFFSTAMFWFEKGQIKVIEDEEL